MISKIFLVAATLAISVLTFSVQAQTPSEEIFKDHIYEMYKNGPHGPRIIKWHQPMRYAIHGVLPAIVNDYIRRKIAELTDKTGVVLQEVHGLQADTHFIFDFQIQPYLSPALVELFRQENQSHMQAVAATEKAFSANLHYSGWEGDAYAVRKSVQLVNLGQLKPGEDIERTILSVIIHSLLGIGPSDRLRPSVMNNPGLMDFSAVDLALTKTIYEQGAPFAHGTPIGAIIDQLVPAVMKNYQAFSHP